MRRGDMGQWWCEHSSSNTQGHHRVVGACISYLNTRPSCFVSAAWSHDQLFHLDIIAQLDFKLILEKRSRRNSYILSKDLDERIVSMCEEDGLSETEIESESELLQLVYVFYFL